MLVNRSPRPPCSALLALGLFCSWLSACGSGSAEYSGVLPSPDGARFVTDVYPILLRDCAFMDCHGKPERFFRIVGPGRARLDESMKQDDPATLAEVQLTYQRALSMLTSSENVDDSLLLRKPLELGAGGQGHKGVDDLGRNIFPTVTDPSYVVLRTWARTKGAPPTAAQVEAAVAAAAAAADAEEAAP